MISEFEHRRKRRDGPDNDDPDGVPPVPVPAEQDEEHRAELEALAARLAEVSAERDALADDVWMVRKDLEVRDANLREASVRLEAVAMGEREAMRRADDALAEARRMRAEVADRDIEIVRLLEAETELAAVKARAGYRLVEAASATLGRIPGVRFVVRLLAGRR